MVRQAQRNNLLCGLADNIIPGGVIILQYADDTIMCLKDNMDKARNLKLLLYLYEMMSGLKINFNKSEVLLIHGDMEKCFSYANIFNCQVGSFPLQYLGVPVSPGRFHVKDWDKLIEKNAKKLMNWKGNCMSIAGRTILINSSLSTTFIYHMSMYLLPKTVTDSLDKHKRTFFWEGNSLKRKYHLVKWSTICQSKEKGGLGIKNIRKMNISLLCKWWWKLDHENGLWQDIVKNKYFRGGFLSSIKHRIDDSPVWSGLLSVRCFYLRGRKLKVNNGKLTLFWEDPWLYNKPLCVVAPILYDLCHDKLASVYHVLIVDGRLNFRR